MLDGSMSGNGNGTWGGAGTSRCDVAIIGAGPYGLAVRAALRCADLDVRIFGPPMSFWRERMPVGMLIRSPWVATSFTRAGTGLSLDDYERSLGRSLSRRLPLDDFIAYGDWFMRRTCPDVDERRVESVTSNGARFELRLTDGEPLSARRVVVAAGIERFAARPAAFERLPRERALHTTELTTPSALSGSRVAVIGGGQSALESAALLHEAGAEVNVLVRRPRVHWLLRSQRLHGLGFMTKVLYAPSDIGPAGLSRLLTFPDTFARIPRPTRDRLDQRAIRPAGSGWLVPRLSDVPIETGVEVASAAMDRGRIALRLASGETRIFDHIVLGTGFRPDIRRYPFLTPELVSRVRAANGYPVLNRWFESSVHGLYFLGTIAAGTFGPLMRFVAGTPFAAPRLASHVVGAGRGSAPRPAPALESV
jgi:Pyridine nucleotide-disulphide oxidoreductase